MEAFDPGKFKARYSLRDGDFEVVTMNGEIFVRISPAVAAVLPEGPIIFDAPDPLPPLKTTRIYAMELIEELAPNATAQKKAKILDILRRLVGELPPDRT